MISVGDSRQNIVKFLTSNHVGVLATVSAAGVPHAATVYLVHDPQLNFYFVTKKDTQKSRNIQETSKAAIAIYNAASQTTVQAEGDVSVVTDPQQTESIISQIWRVAMQTSDSHIPPTSKLVAGGYIVYRLSAPSVRLATFHRPDPAQYESIFENVNTGPSPR